MLPVRMSFSRRRATICSEVRPSGSVRRCCTTRPSTMVSTTSRRLACLVNWYSPDLRSLARLEREHAADEHPGLVDDAFALQQIGDVADAEAARDIDDLVVRQRARRLEALLADDKARAPPTTATRMSSVKIALPAITKGWRTRLERRVGSGTRSGSSAARGLRGAMRLTLPDSHHRRRHVRSAGLPDRGAAGRS